MINILVPMAGKGFEYPQDQYPFPKPLIEIGNKTLIERVVANLATFAQDVQFIFVLSSEDCRKFHIDNTLNIITGGKAKIIRLDNQTKGAACSALLAIEYIDNKTPLVIANSDQLFNLTLSDLLIRMENADAGVVTFESVHPRWSYVRMDEDDPTLVAETAEKRPISRQAIAGIYYFLQGSDFVSAAMRSIKKNASINGSFYISPTLNELILQGKKVYAVGVDSDKYYTFYTPQKLKDYEEHIA